MALSYADVRALDDVAAAEHYDKVAEHTADSLNFWRDEMFRREQARQTGEMLALTRQVRWLTVVVTVATLLNVALFALQVWVF